MFLAGWRREWVCSDIRACVPQIPLVHAGCQNGFLDSPSMEGFFGCAVFGLFYFFLKKTYYYYIYYMIYVIILKNPVWLAGQDTYQ